MPRIHCVGALVVDLLSGPIKQYPVPKVQTQVTTESIRIMPGGGAANAGVVFDVEHMSIAWFVGQGGSITAVEIIDPIARQA